jgi:cell division protein ZipA
MTELRWVLLALGVLVIVAVYLLSQGIPQRWLSHLAPLKRADKNGSVRVEPAFDETESADAAETVPPERPEEPTEQVEKIVTLRFIPTAKEIACDRVILALRAAGLKHGRYGIFHMHASDVTEDPMFSVASLTEPGSFDLSNLTDAKIAGMSFFMVLPGSGDPVTRFDAMVDTARDLARDLEGELRDEKGSSWSIQRERYVREEIIAYCHTLDRSLSGS